ncbi:MAG: formyltetrahydrofolate deformylase [Terrimicrobiaceae bacterium]|nr:formyltetrahydrofolate deformylase [Terrimicrobiaceae bacterium]
MSQEGLVFKMSCPDAVGLVARVTGLVAAHGLNLAEVHSYSDVASKWFFARLRIESADGSGDFARLEQDFSHFAGEAQAEWSLRRSGRAQRMVILASRETHCVTDLLWRRKFGELPAEVPLIISNHRDCESLAVAEGVPFLHVPVNAQNKDEAFREIARRCEEAGADVIVMARFMQILPAWFCARFHGGVINIHHSFLPAFAGADPYRQAFERGVKLIGATCHYATADLDAGPIIDQEVVRVEHFHDLGDLRRLGRDCERLALARGVRYHVEDRVLLHGAKTVVFRD